MTTSLFFDLDGTLTDPRDGILRCLQYALAGIQVPVPTEADLTRLIGPPLQESFRYVLGPSKAHLVPDAIALYRERFGTIGMFENAVYPGIPEGLAALARAGWRLFVVTSKPTAFARPILQHFDLVHHFSGIYGSELSGERSDKGNLISYVLEAEHIPAEQAAMIGDRSHDVIGARANKVRAIGALWGYGTHEELAEAQADRIYATVPEMFSDLLHAAPDVQANSQLNLTGAAPAS